MPGQPGRQDYEYPGQGVCNLLLAMESLIGRRTARVTERCTALDFADELCRQVEESYPDAERIMLVSDNLNPHTRASIYARFAPEQARRNAAKPGHYTPGLGSRRNVVECELLTVARQCLK